jgi:hypothetical protein
MGIPQRNRSGCARPLHPDTPAAEILHHGWSERCFDRIAKEIAVHSRHELMSPAASIMAFHD